MARLIYSDVALADLDRLTEFLLENDPGAAGETAELIRSAIAVLGDHPLIGRPLEEGLRELVISRGRTGYVALYSVEDAHDAVFILSVRHQREVGYSDQNEP